MYEIEERKSKTRNYQKAKLFENKPGIFHEKKNVFVYEQIKELDLPLLFFDVCLTEHYGQCAEDVIVSAPIRVFATRKGKDASAFKYLEIGAHHPVATSAT